MDTFFSQVMNNDILKELELVLRIVVAGMCGAIIGIERKRQLKNAGLKTHLLVALASALMVIVSKYGFLDILSVPGVKVDVSRVASSVVSGVGFLGAGLILVGKREIIGVTTAAGIWATVGIGMSLGAGMYFIGIATTMIVLLSQILLHKHSLLPKEYFGECVNAVLNSESGSIEKLQCTLDEHKFEVVDIKAKKNKENLLEVQLTVRVKGSQNVSQLADILNQSSCIQSFSMRKLS